MPCQPWAHPPLGHRAAQAPCLAPPRGWQLPRWAGSLPGPPPAASPASAQTGRLQPVQPGVAPAPCSQRTRCRRTAAGWERGEERRARRTPRQARARACALFNCIASCWLPPPQVDAAPPTHAIAARKRNERVLTSTTTSPCLCASNSSTSCCTLSTLPMLAGLGACGRARGGLKAS